MFRPGFLVCGTAGETSLWRLFAHSKLGQRWISGWMFDPWEERFKHDPWRNAQHSFSHTWSVALVPTTCLKKLTSTYGSISAVLSPMNAFVTLAMMLELLRGRPSARYTFTQKRAQGRSDGNPSGTSRFLRQKFMNASEHDLLIKQKQRTLNILRLRKYRQYHTCLSAPRHHLLLVLAVLFRPSQRCWYHIWCNLWNQCWCHQECSASPIYWWTGDLQ